MQHQVLGLGCTQQHGNQLVSCTLMAAFANASSATLEEVGKDNGKQQLHVLWESSKGRFICIQFVMFETIVGKGLAVVKCEATNPMEGRKIMRKDTVLSSENKKHDLESTANI